MVKDKNAQWLWIFVIVGAIYFLSTGALFGGPSVPDTNNHVSPDGTCNVEDISFIPKMTRTGKAGTSLSTAVYNYYVLTDGIGHVAGNTATSVSTEKDIEIMFCENSTVYYTVVEEFNTKCGDPLYRSVQLPMADSDVRLYVDNDDGSVNSATNNQSISADGTFEGIAFFTAGVDTFFGNPTSDCQNIAVIEFDKTYFIKATGDNPVSVPGAFVPTSATYDGDNAFYIPKSEGGKKVEFNFVLEASSSEPTYVNPPILHIYDCDIDKNEDDLTLIHGVEDEDLNSIALQHQSVSIYIK